VEKDKKGESCVVVDVLANIEIVKECATDFDNKMMVTEVALNACAQKFSWLIHREPKFPKMKCKGTDSGHPMPQRIRVTNRSKIEEVDEEGESKGNTVLEGGLGGVKKNVDDGSGIKKSDNQNKSSKSNSSSGGVNDNDQEKPEFEVWYYKPERYMKYLEDSDRTDKERAEKAKKDADSMFEDLLKEEAATVSKAADIKKKKDSKFNDKDLDDIDVSSDEEDDQSAGGAGRKGSSKEKDKDGNSDMEVENQDKEDPDDILNGFELDYYKSGNQLVRNLRQKGWVSSEGKVDDFDATKQQEIQSLVKDRIFVCRVHLPKFATQTKIGKLVQLAVSDEGLRLNFPTQYEGYGGRYTVSPYAGIQLWFPREFCSAKVISYWDAAEKVLEIAVPTDVGEKEKGFEADELDDELMNEIF